MVKVERSFPAPQSLKIEAEKKFGSYSKPDVIARLKKDFHNKCYICGLKNLQDPEIEHLLPHKDGKYPHRKFDWNNLFWACGHCNSVKNKEKYDRGIIDCCEEDPEKLMSFYLMENDVNVSAKTLENEKSVLTATLVYEVFNLKNTGMREYKSEMRLQEVNKQMNLLYDNLEKIKKNPEAKVVLRTLKALLRRESEFAAFKRAYIREHSEQFPQLLKYIV